VFLNATIIKKKKNKGRWLGIVVGGFENWFYVRAAGALPAVRPASVKWL